MKIRTMSTVWRENNSRTSAPVRHPNLYSGPKTTRPAAPSFSDIAEYARRTNEILQADIAEVELWVSEGLPNSVGILEKLHKQLAKLAGNVNERTN